MLPENPALRKANIIHSRQFCSYFLHSISPDALSGAPGRKTLAMSWWGKGPDKSKDAPDSAAQASPNARPDPRRDASDFDPNKLPERQKLPRGLQSIVDQSDKDDGFFDELVEGQYVARPTVVAGVSS